MVDDKTQSAKTMDVRYVANLARLNLTEQEVAQFQVQLEHVVSLFNQLREIDVSGIEPMAHAAVIQNVFREDVVRAGLDREAVLKNAPEHSPDLFIVPTIVE
jgi:aspartyl-tRNA(Asn)/glutamyl-tRNA(Gln) amidotransferase subunit C